MENGEELLELIEKDERYKNAYIKAYNEIVESMPGRQQWLKDRVIPRLGDVIFMGVNKWNKAVYHVLKNPKLDDTKFRSYNVVTFGPGYWCQCYFGKFGDKRRMELCSHAGAVMLYRLIEKQLKALTVATP